MSRPKPVRVLEDPAKTAVVLVGCGGTGGYVLQQLCRLLYGLREERKAARAEPPIFGEEPTDGVPEVLLIDGDTVSPSNLRRQYFLNRDVSKNKAAVLAERYARAYGLEISAYPRYLAPSTPFRELVPEGSIVVGAVDNAATRRLLHERLSVYEDVVYVDAGNAAAQALSERPTHEELARVLETGWEGQVVCGVRKEHRTVLPFPADAFPDLVEGEDRLPTEAPCGEAVVSQPQRHLTNVMAATVVLSYLTPLLTDGTVLHHKSFFDARRGYLRSEAAIQLLDQVRV